MARLKTRIRVGRRTGLDSKPGFSASSSVWTTAQWSKPAHDGGERFRLDGGRRDELGCHRARHLRSSRRCKPTRMYHIRASTVTARQRAVALSVAKNGEMLYSSTSFWPRFLGRMERNAYLPLSLWIDSSESRSCPGGNVNAGTCKLPPASHEVRGRSEGLGERPIPPVPHEDTHGTEGIHRCRV